MGVSSSGFTQTACCQKLMPSNFMFTGFIQCYQRLINALNMNICDITALLRYLISVHSN